MPRHPPHVRVDLCNGVGGGGHDGQRAKLPRGGGGLGQAPQNGSTGAGGIAGRRGAATTAATTAVHRSRRLVLNLHSHGPGTLGGHEGHLQQPRLGGHSGGGDGVGGVARLGVGGLASDPEAVETARTVAPIPPVVTMRKAVRALRGLDGGQQGEGHTGRRWRDTVAAIVGRGWRTVA